MKFAAAAVLGLAAAASARPGKDRVLKRQNACILDTVIGADQAQVEASINQWNADVNNVNNFLNEAASFSPGDLLNAAGSALTSANDEPCQLMTLISTSDLGSDPTDAFNCAQQDLMRVFGTHVLDNLNTIIANVNNTAVVQAAIQDINDFRCCNVLSDASILWLDTADDNGISDQVNTLAPTPDACASITCTQACTGLDNGSFGTVSGP